MKPQHFFYYLALIAVLFTACKKNISVTGITLNKDSLYLTFGETEILIATIHPADASNDKVTWKSNNSAVVTVTDDGLVTAIADGKATITVTTEDCKKTATCEVTVDYRIHWIGSYECEYIRSFHTNMTGESWSDTLQEIIAIVTIRRDSSLFMVGKEEYDIKVDSDGSFKGERRGFEGAFGNFGNDSINLNYVIASPGATSWWSYNGKKLKK